MCVEMKFLEVRRAESDQSLSCAAARRGSNGESKDNINHHKESEISDRDLIVAMTKYPLHYS